MNVISIDTKNKNKLKKDLLEVLDILRSKIENGEVEEFIAVASDVEGDVEIYACTKDFLGSVGMFEIGKHILMQSN